MRCPSCGHLESKVVDSRTVREGEAIRRRRACEECGVRFTTYERIEGVMVVKKDGRREEFNRSKVRDGLQIACKKRPVPTSVLDDVVDLVAREIQARGEREVPTEFIGHTVAEALRDIDEVAYVRFMSVYSRFEDTGQFRKAIDQLTATGRRGEPER